MHPIWLQLLTREPPPQEGLRSFNHRINSTNTNTAFFCNLLDAHSVLKKKISSHFSNSKFESCCLIDLFRVIENIPLLQHTSHVLFVVEKCDDDLPNTKCDNCDCKMKKCNEQLATEDRHEPTEEQKSPTKSKVSRLHKSRCWMN